MTLIINPPATAIPVYPWMKVQDFYVGVLEVIRDAQALIDPSYSFEILKNQLFPEPEDPTKSMFVNIMLGARRDEHTSRHDKDVSMTFSFEFWAKAYDEGTNKADAILVERAQYLCAMIEFGLTALYNNVDPNLGIGEMDPRGIDVSFVDPQEIRKSNNLFMFGTLNLEVMFGSLYQDFTNLPALTTVSLAIDNLIADFPANV